MGTALKINVFNSQLFGNQKSHDRRLAKKLSHHTTCSKKKTFVIDDLHKNNIEEKHAVFQSFGLVAQHWKYARTGCVPSMLFDILLHTLSF